MFELFHFSEIFCTSKRTIARKIKNLTPILKLKDKKIRKHFYTIEEAKFIIFSIGIPPNNEFNRQLKDKYPNLF